MYSLTALFTYYYLKNNILILVSISEHKVLALVKSHITCCKHSETLCFGLFSGPRCKLLEGIYRSSNKGTHICFVLSVSIYITLLKVPYAVFKSVLQDLKCMLVHLGGSATSLPIKQLKAVQHKESRDSKAANKYIKPLKGSREKVGS